MKCLLFCCCHSCLVSVQSWSASQTRGATSHPPQVQAQTAGRLYGLGQRESAWMFGGLRTESHRVRVPPHGARWGHAAVWDAHSRSMCFKADSNSLSTMCGQFRSEDGAWRPLPCLARRQASALRRERKRWSTSEWPGRPGPGARASHCQVPTTRSMLVARGSYASAGTSGALLDIGPLLGSGMPLRGLVMGGIV